MSAASESDPSGAAPPAPDAGEQQLRTVLCAVQDRDAQLDLFARAFGRAVPAELLTWRYDRGPHGAALSFLTRDGDGRGICGYACSPRRVLLAGVAAEGGPLGQTGDVMTDPAWRGRGIFRGLDGRCMAEATERGWPAVIGLPNSTSAPLFVRMGWETVGQVCTHTLPLVADGRGRAARLGAGRLAAWGSGRAARRAARARGRLAADLRARGIETRELTAFPGQVGEICARVGRRFSFMVRRDAEFLDWRYLKAPSGLHRALGFYVAGEFIGYVVVQLPASQTGIGFVVDLLLQEDECLPVAIGAALDYLVAKGASAARASAVVGSWWEQRLRAAGFLAPRPTDRKIIILHPNLEDHPLVAAAREPQRWYFTDGDRDDEVLA
ncbi:MAG: GNAT family N-acetyltransferase [Planctomycetota bacterium]|nr:GNAT family N-acetyltransferase [Planctomycetota bacterium]